MTGGAGDDALRARWSSPDGQALLDEVAAGRPMAGTDLRGAALSGRSLRGADLSEANLAGADLRGADLRDAALVAADLSGASLDGARLDRAALAFARLIGASMREASLREADLEGASLVDADLSAADLTDARADSVDATRALLDGAALPPGFAGAPPGTSRPPFTPAAWASVVEAATAAREGLARAPEGPERVAARHRLDRLWVEYTGRLPTVPLTCSPLDGAVFAPQVDVFGLHGPWWDASDPWRTDERWPSSVAALTGALAIVPPVEATPFPVEPGPEVPWVAPALLDRPDVVAVVSTISVGRHRAYPVVYFADPPLPPEVDRPPLWGERDAGFFRVLGVFGVRLLEPLEVDTDLRPWVKAGKLRWVAPGDSRLLPRTDVGGCPYLGLRGRRTPVTLIGGDVLS